MSSFQRLPILADQRDLRLSPSQMIVMLMMPLMIWMGGTSMDESSASAKLECEFRLRPIAHAAMIVVHVVPMIVIVPDDPKCVVTINVGSVLVARLVNFLMVIKEIHVLVPDHDPNPDPKVDVHVLDQIGIKPKNIHLNLQRRKKIQNRTLQLKKIYPDRQ